MSTFALMCVAFLMSYVAGFLHGRISLRAPYMRDLRKQLDLVRDMNRAIEAQQQVIDQQHQMLRLASFEERPTLQ